MEICHEDECVRLGMSCDACPYDQDGDDWAEALRKMRKKGNRTKGEGNGNNE